MTKRSGPKKPPSPTVPNKAQLLTGLVYLGHNINLVMCDLAQAIRDPEFGAAPATDSLLFIKKVLTTYTDLLDGRIPKP